MPLQLALTALLLGGELLAITLLVDAQVVMHAGGLAGFAGTIGSWALKGLMLAGALTAVFGLLNPAFQPVANSGGARWFLAPKWLGVHLLATLFFDLSAYLVCSSPPPFPADWLAAIAILTGLLSMGSGLLVFLPARFWRGLVEATPLAPVYGILTASACVVIVITSRPLAERWRKLAFDVVSAVLQNFSPEFHADRQNFVIGARNFQVEIAPQCSGYEGVALMLVFGVLWLLLFRREFRFPQALLLLPLGMAAMWILNCVRIILLILIGVWGAPEIAIGGFHSQAGWIAFVTLAITCAIVWQSVPWASAHPAAAPTAKTKSENRTAAYLLPFLAILGAGMVAQAFAHGFEWLYPLRVVAALGVLWIYRRSYSGLEWRPRWDSLWLGALVLPIWLGADWATGHAHAAMPAALTSIGGLWRNGWIVWRLLGAVVTVPIAEELAFRGFLLRRIVAADFEAVGLRVWTPVALVVSSAAFAIMHGKRWPAALAAGAIYAWAMHRSGSLGNAVAAHATTNLLLSGVVLFTGDWSYW